MTPQPAPPDDRRQDVASTRGQLHSGRADTARGSSRAPGFAGVSRGSARSARIGDGVSAVIRPHSSAMYAVAPERCPHCGRVVAIVSLEHAEKFDTHWPLVVCHRCHSALPRTRRCTCPATGPDDRSARHGVRRRAGTPFTHQNSGAWTTPTQCRSGRSARVNPAPALWVPACRLARSTRRTQARPGRRSSGACP